MLREYGGTMIMTQNNKAVALASVSVASWMTVATAFKIALRELSVYEMLLVASATALIVISISITASGKWGELKKVSRKGWECFAMMGLLNPVAYYLVMFKAYDYLPAQIAQPVNYIWPIMLLVLLALFTGQRIPKRKYIGMLVSLGGLTVISMGGSGIQENLPPMGFVLALGSALLWAIYWMLNDRYKDLADESISLFIGFLFGTIYLAAGTIFVPVEYHSLSGVLSGVYIGLFEMGIPFLCFGTAIRMTSNPALINQMCYLAPFLSLFFISMILHEPIMPTTYTGLALIIAGLIYNQYFSAAHLPKMHLHVRFHLPRLH